MEFDKIVPSKFGTEHKNLSDICISSHEGGGNIGTFALEARIVGLDAVLT